MSSFLLLPSGDLDLSNGGMQLTQGQQEILQLVRAAVREFQGEWFLDTSRGLPYFQTILQKGTGQDVVENLYRQVILAVDGILAVTSLALTVSSQARTATLAFSAQTVAGNLPVTTIPVGLPTPLSSAA